MITRTTNLRKFKTINLLRKLSKKAKVWGVVSEKLAKSKKNRVEVNIWKIEKYSKDKDIIVVPGKVLGEGTLSKKVTVVAFNFSERAKEVIKKAGGEVYLIDEFVQKNPNKKVKILV